MRATILILAITLTGCMASRTPSQFEEQATWENDTATRIVNTDYEQSKQYLVRYATDCMKQTLIGKALTYTSNHYVEELEDGSLRFVQTNWRGPFTPSPTTLAATTISKEEQHTKIDAYGLTQLAAKRLAEHYERVINEEGKQCH